MLRFLVKIRISYFFRSSKTRIPFTSGAFGIANSLAEQIIPLDAIPRSSASLITIPDGITAPTFATTTFCPASTLGAPQTICNECFPNIYLAHF